MAWRTLIASAAALLALGGAVSAAAHAAGQGDASSTAAPGPNTTGVIFGMGAEKPKDTTPPSDSPASASPDDKTAQATAVAKPAAAPASAAIKAECRTRAERVRHAKACRR